MNELTSREKQIIKLIVKGWTNKVIGEYVNISEHTAKFHVANIARKLQVSSRTEIAVNAVKNGWA